MPRVPGLLMFVHKGTQCSQKIYPANNFRLGIDGDKLHHSFLLEVAKIMLFGTRFSSPFSVDCHAVVFVCSHILP